MKPILVEMQAFGPFAGRQVIDFSLLGEKTFFLIHGSTGSGKTTILDAMCFALFGDSSGGERDGSQMRSHHADAATLTQVRFEFALGAQRFRVLRVPEQERPSLRGSGGARQLQRAEIHRLGNASDGKTEEIPLASGWRKVTDAVVRLLGFESKQFRQVIMLPQGQFFEFLKSGTQEREKILQTLFGTEIYRRIEERLSRQAQEVANAAAEVMTRRDTLLGQAQVADEAALDVRVNDLATQLAKAQSELNVTAQAERDAQSHLTAALQLAESFVEFDKAESALKTLKDQEEAKARLRTTCARARAAAGVMPHAVIASKAATQAAEAAESFARYQAQEQMAVAESVKAEEALVAASERAPEIDELNRRLIKLDELSAKVQSLDAARTQLKTADAQIREAVSAHDDAEKLRQGAAETQARLSGELQARQLLAAKLDGLRASVSLLEGQATRAADLAKSQTDAVAAQRDQQQKSGALELAAKAEFDARSARDATHRAWVAGQAARLAAGLVADQACPVCGSNHHPAPAHLDSSQGDEIVHDDALEAAEEALRNAVSMHITARGRFDAAALLSLSMNARIQALRTDLGEVTATAADLKQAVVEAKKALKSTEEARTGLAETQARAEAAATAHTQAQELANQTASKMQTARGFQQQCQAVVTEREKEVPPDLAAPEQLAQAHGQTAQQLSGLKKALEDAHASASKAREAVATASAHVQASHAAMEQLNRNRHDAALERDQKIEAAGFDHLQAFEAARMDQEELAKTEGELKRFDADLAAAQQRLGRVSAAVSGQSRPDVPGLTAATEQAKAVHLAASNAVRDVIANQTTAVNLATALRELAAEYQGLQARYGVVKRVSDLANGVGGQRMSFQRYVLATLLEEVLAATTQRLQVMSKGRYELRRAVTSGDRRAAAGLDLEAFDQYTGTVRPVTTLSGGESFLTSLALALGLSDVVQSYAGGIRLDAIFVDEGFGTLDTEALDFAIRALKDLQQAGRMVGIISHVTELREWIDARLEVKGSASGSVAAFVV